MSTYRRWLKEPPQYEPDIGFLADARDDLLIEFAKAALPTAWEVLVNARDQGFEKAPEESEIDNLAKVTFIIASKLLAEYERRVRES